MFWMKIHSNNSEGPGRNSCILYPESGPAAFHGSWEHTVSVARKILYAKDEGQRKFPSLQPRRHPAPQELQDCLQHLKGKKQSQSLFGSKHSATYNLLQFPLLNLRKISPHLSGETNSPWRLNTQANFGLWCLSSSGLSLAFEGPSSSGSLDYRQVLWHGVLEGTEC